MIDNKAVGKAIAAMRIREKMTQQELAAKVNVSHQAVSKWESGAALPDTQTLLNLSRLFQLTVDALLSGETPEETPAPVQPAMGQEAESAPQTSAHEPQPAIENAAFEEAADPGDPFVREAERRSMEFNDQINIQMAREFSGLGARIAQKIQNKLGGLSDKISAQMERAFQAQPDPASETDDMPSDWARVLKLAPFMSAPALGRLALKYADQGNLEQLLAIVPFLNHETLERLLKRYEEQVNLEAIVQLAPFVSAESLFALIQRLDQSLDLDTIAQLAPFLESRMVDQLVSEEESGWGEVEEAPDAPVTEKADEADALGQMARSAADDGEFDFLRKIAPQLSEEDLSYVAEAAAEQEEF